MVGCITGLGHRLCRMLLYRMDVATPFESAGLLYVPKTIWRCSASERMTGFRPVRNLTSSATGK